MPRGLWCSLCGSGLCFVTAFHHPPSERMLFPPPPVSQQSHRHSLFCRSLKGMEQQDWEMGPHQVMPLSLSGSWRRLMPQTMTSSNRIGHSRFVLSNCMVCPYMYSSRCCCLCCSNLLLTYLVLWQPRSGD